MENGIYILLNWWDPKMSNLYWFYVVQGEGLLNILIDFIFEKELFYWSQSFCDYLISRHFEMLWYITASYIMVYILFSKFENIL